VIDTRDSPEILPKIIACREIGDTKTSWLKSFSRSSMSEMIPVDDDWKRVWANTPVKVKIR
jgi:hypothetical protein